MKKIVRLSLLALSIPLVGMAQSVDDDLYYTPKKSEDSSANKQENTNYGRTTSHSASVYVSPGTTVVVQDLKGNIRDVDEYNRRFSSSDNDFELQNDTLVIKEKNYGERGEWVNGFEGTQDDYEYAERLIRFRNPRYAIPVSSPLYWDVVYGVDSWNWNVYEDGFYAYAFPSFTNNLWFDWRYGNMGIGWGWSYPYYSWGGYYPGYWGSSWNWGWGHHHHHHHGWYDPWYGSTGGWNNAYYNNRRPSSSVRPSYNSSGSSSRPSYSTTRPSGSRVVGTRTDSSVRPGSSIGSRPGSSRLENSSSQRPSYTRPSSTRPSSGTSVRGNSSSSRGSGSSYSRPSGSSTTSSRPTYNNNSRSSYPENNSRSNSSNYSGSSSSRSSGSSFSGGSSSRSGGGSSSAGRSSSGGGSSRSGGRR